MSIEIKGLTLELPIYNANARSLRKMLIPTSVGGALFSTKNDTIVIRALENIDLEIGDGERVALIGPNGAGKTTLLRVLSGVYTPGRGSVVVRGKVSAALNTSLGMDLEATGRENIFLLGYYRGMSRAQIADSVDEILNVASLGQYIDLPVNTYSAGMQGRLTFAVATAFSPDVLIMDEWLGAGDGAFVAKAHERTSDFVNKARILVLASHSLSIVREFCDRGVYLRRGRIEASGPVEDVIRKYEDDIRSGAEATQ